MTGISKWQVSRNGPLMYSMRHKELFPVSDFAKRHKITQIYALLLLPWKYSTGLFISMHNALLLPESMLPQGQYHKDNSHSTTNTIQCSTSYIWHTHRKSVYCKSTHFGVLLYLANLANCVSSLIFVAANIYVDRTLHRRPAGRRQI